MKTAFWHLQEELAAGNYPAVVTSIAIYKQQRFSRARLSNERYGEWSVRLVR